MRFFIYLKWTIFSKKLSLTLSLSLSPSPNEDKHEITHDWLNSQSQLSKQENPVEEEEEKEEEEEEEESGVGGGNI